MSIFRRKKRAAANAEPTGKDARRATFEHFTQFVSTRRGVEAYLEPATNVTQPTMVLVAVDGEWTRRRIPSMDAGREVARELGIPVYDVNLTGYPAKMREWTANRRRPASPS